MSAVLPLPTPTVIRPAANLRRAEVRFRDYLQRHAVQTPAHLRRVLADPERKAFLEDGQVLRLGELLVTEGLVTPEEVTTTLARRGAQAARRIGELLVEAGVLADEALRHVLAQRMGVPAINLERWPVDVAATLRLPRALCHKHDLLPIGVLDGQLLIAVADAGSGKALETARFAARMPVRFLISQAAPLRAAIVRHLGRDEDIEAVVDAAEAYGRSLAGADDTAPLDLSSVGQGEDRPVVRLVNSLLNDALQRRASDLHLRPTPSGIDVQFRVDGQMVRGSRLSRSLLAAMVARIKVMARMDVTERMLPQDGSARIVHGGQLRDVRISVIPTVNGESVAVRILGTDSALLSLDALGFEPDDLRRLRTALLRTSGMVLVTGPTGSGKSTTLYAALKEVQRRGVKVMTVEEPVECHLDGTEQIAVNQATGFTFSRALRHILRHDPDVIMVGEVRDRETAQIALEAALTGHLVLSTLHTNSAAAAFPRLVDMGIEPFIVASTVSAVIAQRLVRYNCMECLQREPVSDEVRLALGVGRGERFSRGVGCAACGGTGYQGRGVVYELLTMDDRLRDAVHGGATSDHLDRLAIEQGMRPLTEQALDLARQRRISLAEVFRVRLN